MASFFDDISAKADARRSLSKDKLDRLLEQGIIASKERRDKGIANVAAIPAGLFTGATGFFGDLEALGKGLYRAGATRNAIGQAQEGHVGALEEIANIYNTNDTLMPNSEGQREFIKDKLKDTWYGDQVEQGDIGLLLGEILAPVPTVAGLGKAGKVIGNAVADTVGTGIKAERGMGLSGGINQLLGLAQDPAMVIGPKSKLWDADAAAKFNKAIDKKAAKKIIAQRKKAKSFSPNSVEAKLWEETAQSGNPTFLDIDGVIKQEIPTGDIKLTKPLTQRLKKNSIDNKSLQSYGVIDEMLQTGDIPKNIPKNVTGQTINKGNGIAEIRVNKTLPKQDLNDILAHEGQHVIQGAEQNWATGSNPHMFSEKNIVNQFDVINQKTKEFDDMFDDLIAKKTKRTDGVPMSEDDYKGFMEFTSPELLKANKRKAAMHEIMKMDNKIYKSPDEYDRGLSIFSDNSGTRMYERDPGEMLARATSARTQLTADDIAKNNILEQYNKEALSTDIYPNDVLDAKLSEIFKANGNTVAESNKFPKILDKALANPNNKEYRKYFKGLDIKEGSFKRELQPSGHSHLTFEMNDGRVGKLTNVPNTPDNDHNSLQNTLKYIRNGINRAGQDIDAGNGRAGGSFEWIQPQKKNNNVSYSMDVNSGKFNKRKTEELLNAKRPGYIYKTVNTVNGKKYGGSHILPKVPFEAGTHKGKYFDENYYGSGTELQKDIQRYGKDKFINVKEQDTTTLKGLIGAEESYLERINAKDSDDWYNRHNKYTGYSVNEGTGKKISDKLTGKPKTTDHKNKTSKAGKEDWERRKKEGKDKFPNRKSVSKEDAEKMAAARAEFYKTKEGRESFVKRQNGRGVRKWVGKQGDVRWEAKQTINGTQYKKRFLTEKEARKWKADMSQRYIDDVPFDDLLDIPAAPRPVPHNKGLL